MREENKAINARYLMCILVVLFILSLTALPGSAGPSKSSLKRILILNSYHDGYKWTDDLVRGIRDTIKASAVKEVELCYEYMDTKRHSGAGYYKLYAALLENKYRRRQVDLIICSDNNAFEFLKTYTRRIFPGIPVVFSGVNFFDPSDLAGYDNFTGVSEETDFNATIKLALQLHPGTKNVFVITDTTTTGRRLKTKLSKIIHEFGDLVSFEIADNISMPHLLEKIAGLPDNSLVLYTLFFRDGDGNFFEYDDSISMIAGKSRVPVYGTWDFSLGYGIVGGMLTSGYAQGQAASDIALRIFNGEKTSDIQVVLDSPNRYMFDYRQLIRFGIDLTMIPEESIIINRPRTIMDDYAQVVYVALSAFFLLMTTISLLVWNVMIRKRAENMIRKSEKRFRELSELLPQIIFEFDLEGNILYTNRSGFAKTGYTADDLARGIKITEIIAPEQHERMWNNIRKRFKDGIELAFEYDVMRKDGSSFPVLAYSAPILGDDGQAGVRGILVDISIQKRLQNDLAQTQKIEALGTLAGGIAHDFNNILTAILGYTELTLERGCLDAEDHSSIETVYFAADRAKEMVKQILMFSRKGQGEKEPILIHNVVDEALKLVRQTIPSTINMSIELDRLTGPVLADTTQIHQVIINLCTNAYHSMQDQGGDLLIRLEKTVVSPETAAANPNLREGEYALLTVGDNGTGMTPETVSRIFDPFFTTKEQGKGTGMGLAVVHGIVQNHGGTIEVESQPDSGTLFMVFLPIYSGSMKRISRERPAMKRGSEHILLVDDEPAIIDLGNRGLKSLGYRVTSATSPIEALEQFTASPEIFDIIITDQTMPQLRGDLLASKAMKIRPDIPVIICTGHSETLNEEKAHFMGIRALLMKPVGIDKLSETIRQILDGQT